jgi:hypothetical protein
MLGSALHLAIVPNLRCALFQTEGAVAPDLNRSGGEQKL